MEQFEIVFKALRNIAGMLALTGILVIVAGVLIFIYPQLLSILVSLALILAGIFFLASAAKVNRYSKFKIKL